MDRDAGTKKNRKKIKSKKEPDRFSTDTWYLLNILNALAQTKNTPDWLRSQLLRVLARIPLRKDGVRATLELIFARHPSNTSTTDEAAAAQNKGGNMTTEALKEATKLLSKIPADIDPYVWFNSLANQLWPLLDGEEGSDYVRAASEIVAFGILGQRKHGAPGNCHATHLASEDVRDRC